MVDTSRYSTTCGSGPEFKAVFFPLFFFSAVYSSWFVIVCWLYNAFLRCLWAVENDKTVETICIIQPLGCSETELTTADNHI